MECQPGGEIDKLLSQSPPSSRLSTSLAATPVKAPPHSERMRSRCFTNKSEEWVSSSSWSSSSLSYHLNNGNNEMSLEYVEEAKRTLRPVPPKPRKECLFLPPLTVRTRRLFKPLPPHPRHLEPAIEAGMGGGFNKRLTLAFGDVSMNGI